MSNANTVTVAKSGSGTFRVEIGESETLEVVRGDLTLRLTFNGQGGFCLEQSGVSLAQQSSAPEAPKPGQRMPDGTIYAGISPDTGKAFYAAARDADKLMNYDEAQIYARSCQLHGRNDWRLPSVGELNVLFNNRAEIGGFNEKNVGSSDHYWSLPKRDSLRPRNQSFFSGVPNSLNRLCLLSVRCVRE